MTDTTTPVSQSAATVAVAGDVVNKDELVVGKDLAQPVQADGQQAGDASAEPAKKEEPASADEPAKADPADTGTEEPETEFVSYGHAGADAAVSMLKESGVTVDEAKSIFAEVAKTNDVSKIDYKALEAKVGKTKADLIVAGVKDYYSAELGKAEAIKNAVHTVVGGEESMQKITTWLVGERTKNPELDSEIAVYAEMMQQGPIQAKTAAKALLDLYNASDKTSGLNNNLIKGDAAADTKVEYIDRPTFIQKLMVAERTGNVAEAARLRAQRQATIKAGKA